MDGRHLREALRQVSNDTLIIIRPRNGKDILAWGDPAGRKTAPAFILNADVHDGDATPEEMAEVIREEMLKVQREGRSK